MFTETYWTEKKYKTEISNEVLVRTADEKNFSKGYTTKWRYKLYTITECNIDAIQTCLLKSILERYKDVLLEKSEETMKTEEVNLNLNLETKLRTMHFFIITYNQSEGFFHAY